MLFASNNTSAVSFLDISAMSKDTISSRHFRRAFLAQI